MNGVLLGHGLVNGVPKSAVEYLRSHVDNVLLCGTVSVDGVEGEENLVNCAVVCKTQKDAMETAFEKAYGIYQEYLEELKARNAPPVTFNEVWEEVDRYDGIEREYGFDPIFNKVAYCAIRVVKAVVA